MQHAQPKYTCAVSRNLRDSSSAFFFFAGRSWRSRRRPAVRPCSSSAVCNKAASAGSSYKTGTRSCRSCFRLNIFWREHRYLPASIQACGHHQMVQRLNFIIAFLCPVLLTLLMKACSWILISSCCNYHHDAWHDRSFFFFHFFHFFKVWLSVYLRLFWCVFWTFNLWEWLSGFFSCFQPRSWKRSICVGVHVDAAKVWILQCDATSSLLHRHNFVVVTFLRIIIIIIISYYIQ